jgi:hypothetical protein
MAWILEISSDEYNIVVICAIINYTQNSPTKLHNYLFKFRAELIWLKRVMDSKHH